LGIYKPSAPPRQLINLNPSSLRHISHQIPSKSQARKWLRSSLSLAYRPVEAPTTKHRFEWKLMISLLMPTDRTYFYWGWNEYKPDPRRIPSPDIKFAESMVSLAHSGWVMELSTESRVVTAHTAVQVNSHMALVYVY
jgi:hypothetical protein